MDYLKQHFIDWGAFYQTIVALIFGLISIILWYQDRKKSALILELQQQTGLLGRQLQHFINLDRPCLQVTSQKYQYGGTRTFLVTIENSGSDLYELSFSTTSDSGIFEIQILNKPDKLASKNSFSLSFIQIKETGTLIKDPLTFMYKDKYDRRYSQELILMYSDDRISFNPPTIIETKS